MLWWPPKRRSYFLSQLAMVKESVKKDYTPVPKVNGVYSGSRPILHPSFTEICSVIFVGTEVKIYWTDFHKTQMEDGSRPRIDPINFWKDTMFFFSLSFFTLFDIFIIFSGDNVRKHPSVFQWMVSMIEHKRALWGQAVRSTECRTSLKWNFSGYQGDNCQTLTKLSFKLKKKWQHTRKQHNWMFWLNRIYSIPHLLKTCH